MCCRLDFNEKNRIRGKGASTPLGLYGKHLLFPSVWLLCHVHRISIVFYSSKIRENVLMNELACGNSSRALMCPV